MNKFVWGVATAAHQIEGAYKEDGKGESIWDVFAHQKGKICNDANGDVACDHYHRYREDVALMKELGVGAYRFSLSWPRIFPDGAGKLNSKGMDFYSRLVDELLHSGIQPYVTLYHWDLPQKLFERGGWLNEDSPQWFYDYADAVGKTLGDRVKNFITINEPQVVVGGFNGWPHAPSLTYTTKDLSLITHNLLKAHGTAVKALRQTVEGVQIGYAPCGWVTCPRDDTPQEIERARKHYFRVDPKNPFDTVALFSDPVLKGDYPREYYSLFGAYLPKITQDDLRLISQPIDFYGQNIYSGFTVCEDENGNIVKEPFPAGSPKTFMRWDVYPQALYWGAKFLYERYHKPIYITENGMADLDIPRADGAIHDSSRIAYMESYIGELLRAKQDGADVRGYFYWSLLDNFEWADGYDPRFGLIHVDYATQKRTMKESFHWYKRFIEQRS